MDTIYSSIFRSDVLAYPSLCRTSSTCSNIFSQTTRPIKTFHVEPSWVGRKKVSSNGHGHMTKRTAMPMHGKNLFKSSSSEPIG